MNQSLLRDYYILCKPRVVLLMLLTSMVGMYLSTTANHFSWDVFVLGNIGIGLMAASAAAINHIVDQHIDQLMRRTQKRPIAQGRISTKQALIFAFSLCLIGAAILILYVNILTAALTFLTLIGYAVIYTFYLKHKTAQNIVIGGIAGAAPPLLGWVAMTGHIDPGAIILLLIIFVWTPPHFWALAIYRVEEYKKADVPMLPVTHGIDFTKKNIVLYTILLSAISLLPCVIGMAGWIYLCIAIVLNARFLQYAVKLYRSVDNKIAMKMFWYSIIYLGVLFVALMVLGNR